MNDAFEVSTRRLAPRDYLLAGTIGLIIATFHFGNGYPLADSVLLQSFNWAFDLDSSRFIGGWCAAGADVGGYIGGSFLAKHALAIAIRPACLGLTAIMGSAPLALMALTALCAGCVAATAYVLAAQFCSEIVDRIMLSVGFAVSAQPLLLGVLPETYGFALAGIGLHLALVAHRIDTPPAADRLSVVTLVINAGVTVTNAGLNILSSGTRAWNRLSARRWLAIEAKTCLCAGALLFVIVAPLTMLFTPSFLADASAVPKQVWWTININRGLEPAGLARVAATFLCYGLVAPAITFVYLPEPDAHTMLDFRAFRYGVSGGVALAGWLLAVLGSICFAARDPAFRRMLAIVVVWLIANIALHWYWQFRGSVYLYGAHTAFPLFALFIIAYSSAIRRYPMVPVRLAATLMFLLTAVNNLGIYGEMIDFLMAQPRTG